MFTVIIRIAFTAVPTAIATADRLAGSQSGKTSRFPIRRRRPVTTEVGPISDRLFVPASKLYEAKNRTPTAHPAHQASDDEVRQALEQRVFEPTAARPRALLVGGIRVALCVLLIAIGTRSKPRFWFFIYLVFCSVEAFLVGTFRLRIIRHGTR